MCVWKGSCLFGKMSNNNNNSNRNNSNTNGTVTLDTEKHYGRSRRYRGQRLDYSNGTASVSGSGTGSEEFTVSDDGDEFGGASDGEGPNSMFLTSMENEYEQETGEVLPSVVRPTKSQLQAHLPMGLDKGKHEDIGGLLLNASSTSGASQKAAAAGSRKIKDESVSSNNSGDEFGDADDHDLPAPQCLTESDHDMPPPLCPTVPRRVGPSSSGGLDSEKHEEIGDLLDSQHDETLLESTQDTRDEFGDAQENDAPVNQYLLNATESMWREDRGVVPRRVTPSQLQAYIPSGLDSEKHEEIGDLMDSRHDHDDLDEFGDADEHDMPHRRFLHDSTHSIMSFDDFEKSSHKHVQRATGRRINAPKQRDVAVNKRDKSGRPKGTEMTEGEKQFLDRWNDSNNDENDDLESDIEYEDLKGSDTLDTEKHEDLGDFKEVVSDDEDEFELAGENDDPVPRYLQSQYSLHGDDLLAAHGRGGGGGGRPIIHGLDHENHEDISGFRSSTMSMSDDEEEFECAGSYDIPSSMFLKHQESMQHHEFLFSADDVHSDEGLGGSTS